MARNAADTNRLYYKRITSGRDEYWRKMAAPRHRVRVLLGWLDKIVPASVIDLGCGNGVLLAEVRARHPRARLVGVDLSAEQIAENRRHASWGGWHTADLDRSVEFEPRLRAAFDVVLATEVIEHVDHPDVFLGNAYALARPGGHLLLSTQSGTVHETERRVGHRRHFTVEEVSDLLTRTGWAAANVWCTGFPFHDLSKWYANRNPDRSMARFGEGAYSWKENLLCLGLRFAFRLNSKTRGTQLFAVACKP